MSWNIYAAAVAFKCISVSQQTARIHSTWQVLPPFNGKVETTSHDFVDIVTPHSSFFTPLKNLWKKGLNRRSWIVRRDSPPSVLNILKMIPFSFLYVFIKYLLQGKGCVVTAYSSMAVVYPGTRKRNAASLGWDTYRERKRSFFTGSSRKARIHRE